MSILASLQPRVNPSDQLQTVLASPLGSSAYIDAVAIQVVCGKAQPLDIFPNLPSLQASWLLLYYCGAPRLNPLLRTVPPDSIRRAAVMHDDSVQGALRKILAILDKSAGMLACTSSLSTLGRGSRSCLSGLVDVVLVTQYAHRPPHIGQVGQILFEAFVKDFQRLAFASCTT